MIDLVDIFRILKNHKLVIIGFWLIAVGWWIKKGLDLVLSVPINESVFLAIFLMSAPVSFSDFMTTWFTSQHILKTIIYFIKISWCHNFQKGWNVIIWVFQERNITFTSIKELHLKTTFPEIVLLAIVTFKHFDFFYLAWRSVIYNILLLSR